MIKTKLLGKSDYLNHFEYNMLPTYTNKYELYEL